MTSVEDKVRLYELVLENGRSASPFVWRIRYALAHKGVPCETVPVGFTEVSRIMGGRFKTVPVIEHGDTAMAESWDIAEYLDRTFPSAPAFDVHNAARPEDRAYFRRSREEYLKGVTLEEFTADRVSRLPMLRDALAPLRAHLSRYDFLGGSAPNYADYVALGAFHWVASVSTLPLLANNDTLRPWIERGFDLYGGLGRDPRMKPLFE
jgi:glutathione S-transferase